MFSSFCPPAGEISPLLADFSVDGARLSTAGDPVGEHSRRDVKTVYAAPEVE
jgi:hypothetical protein